MQPEKYLIEFFIVHPTFFSLLLKLFAFKMQNNGIDLSFAFGKIFTPESSFSVSERNKFQFKG